MITPGLPGEKGRERTAPAPFFAPGPAARTAVLTVLALTAFAANSVLCRLALRGSAIDAGSFTALRLASGAAALGLLTALRGHHGPGGSWNEALLLFLYAAAFSFAYLRLSAGTGALVLFASVQITMIAAGHRLGERPGRFEWAGLALAFGGLVGLLLPGWTAPSWAGLGLMGAAGIAWGGYSLRGRGQKEVLIATRGNFTRAVVPALGVGLLVWPSSRWSVRGALLAVVSGALTSGLGYVLWYAALQGLTATRAAIVQLAVPVLVAMAGVLFLSEGITLRLALSSGLILAGIGLAILGRRGA
ncbi:MAG TPA: DMT family transporter [Candidatus Polarisedimenticolia bacterium]|jgi:drug/metabolite transporter (DMT)-like permease|nr:DMT family transporter [Candidatus Polarisedimenticolia bacterium]